MLADLTSIIQRGIVDNTAQGTIRLKLWCVDDSTPISLEMEGNCLRDIAGCRVSFTLLRDEEPTEGKRQSETLLKLARALREAEEPIIAGDMTLSRRLYLPAQGNKLLNVLSLEFFLGARVRFLIETEQFECETSLPTWACSSACEDAQEIINMAALHDHVLSNVAAFHGPSLTHIGTAEMPTCRWDYVLNRAEAYMIIAPSIRAKYVGRLHGDLAEAFVLDRLNYLQAAAEADENCEPPPAPEARHGWEVLDFMEPEHAKLARSAMRHPLFAATAHLSQIIQKYVIAKISQYAGNQDIEQLIASYSGIISHVLATIMLAREGQVRLGAITSRAESLCTRIKQLSGHADALNPKTRELFLSGVESLLAELKNFLCMLRK